MQDQRHGFVAAKAQDQSRDADRRGYAAALPLAGAALILGLSWHAARAQEVGEDGLIHAHGVSTFGELRYGPDAGHLDYVNPDAPQGGEMSMSWSSGSFDSLHPYSRIGRAAVLSTVFFESMLEGTADEIGSAYCLLCEDIAFPEDKSYVIFTLRDGVAFSDGTPMTARDVLFSYEILRDEGLPSFRATLPLTISRAEILDDRRIRFDFNPEAPLRDRIQTAGGLPVFSEASHIASGLAFEDSRLEPLVGSGPYVLGDVDPGNRIVYIRDRDYWGDDLWLTRGRNNFDSIRIEYYGDGLAAFEGFTAGNYAFRQENSSQAWANNYDFPALDNGTVIRAELPNGNIASGQSFMINLRRPQFQDVRVRSAIAHMFNFEWTDQTLFYGLYDPIVSFWENTWMEAEGLPSEAELALLEPLRDLLPETVFTEEAYAVPLSDPDRALDRRQSRRATALLEEAGWTVQDGVLKDAAGTPFTFDILLQTGSSENQAIIDMFVQSLTRLGITATVTNVDAAQYRERTDNYDFDMTYFRRAMSLSPGNEQNLYWGTRQADDIGGRNLMGVKSEAVDSLINVLLTSEEQSDFLAAAQALDRVLTTGRYVIPIYQWNISRIAHARSLHYPEALPLFGDWPGWQPDVWWYEE